ncbi:hypothetical protein V5O48_008808 [Marasmius crinis-equi]|uniref:DUF6699 domain-containing protein n=1 Tax=Marasmius crinis-equi TaxID=585013 RepID=A0ABR3FCX3_9AGAR
MSLGNQNSSVSQHSSQSGSSRDRRRSSVPHHTPNFRYSRPHSSHHSQSSSTSSSPNILSDRTTIESRQTSNTSIASHASRSTSQGTDSSLFVYPRDALKRATPAQILEEKDKSIFVYPRDRRREAAQPPPKQPLALTTVPYPYSQYRSPYVTKERPRTAPHHVPPPPPTTQSREREESRSRTRRTARVHFQIEGEEEEGEGASPGDSTGNGAGVQASTTITGGGITYVQRLKSWIFKSRNPKLSPLLHYTPQKIPIRVDLRFPGAQAIAFLPFPVDVSPADLFRPAMTPALRFMRLYHHMLPWYIDLVSEASEPLGITVGNVVYNLIRELQKPVGIEEGVRHVGIERARDAREREGRGRGTSDKQGQVRRVDYLMGQTMFHGLERVGGGMWRFRTSQANGNGAV